jgi:hypothetical protein
MNICFFTKLTTCLNLFIVTVAFIDPHIKTPWSLVFFVLAFKSLVIARIIMHGILLPVLDLETNFSMIIYPIWSGISII